MPPAAAVAVNGHANEGKLTKPKPIRVSDPEAAEIAVGMARLIRRWGPERKIRCESPASVEEIRRLIQVDGRPAVDVRCVLVWLFSDGPDDYKGDERFDWRDVIVSGRSLRKSWDHLASLYRKHRTETPA